MSTSREELEEARQEFHRHTVEAEQAFQREWPHRFVFYDAYDWPERGTTDAEFDRIIEWINQFAGNEGEGWISRGDPMGVSITLGLKDAELASLFKLTFPTAEHLK